MTTNDKAGSYGWGDRVVVPIGPVVREKGGLKTLRNAPGTVITQCGISKLVSIKLDSYPNKIERMPYDILRERMWHMLYGTIEV